MYRTRVRMAAGKLEKNEAVSEITGSIKIGDTGAQVLTINKIELRAEINVIMKEEEVS